MISYLSATRCEGKIFAKIFRSIGEKVTVNVVGKGAEIKLLKTLVLATLLPL